MTTRTLHHLIIATSVCTMLIGLAAILTERAALKATADEGEGTACHIITSPDMQVDSKYGSPVSFFNNAPLLLRVQCENDGALSVFAGTGASAQYIYQFGYRKVGTSWERIKFTGAKRVGSWFLGSASTTISARDADAQGTVLAYVCENVQGSWKCGCSDKACTQAKWQVQRYQKGDSKNEVTATPAASSTWPVVYYASAMFGGPGDTITITGERFSTGTDENIVLWGSSTVSERVRSLDGQNLTVTVPQLQSDKYEVRVRNSKGTSQDSVVIWVEDTSLSVPVINSVTPERGKQGDTFTVYGTGFDKENNDIITTFGAYSRIPSPDGKSLTFTFKPFKETVQWRTEGGKVVDFEHKIYVTVVNAGGYSNSATFTLVY